MEAQSKVERQVECASCVWNKFCISPPSMTESEVQEEIKAKDDGDDKDKEGSLFKGLMTALIFSGKDKTCPACPIFIRALRDGPELSQKIKQLMQSS